MKAATEREGKSVSRLDRKKDHCSDCGRESISMVTTMMFSPLIFTPIFTRFISSFYFPPLQCLCPLLLHHQSSLHGFKLNSVIFFVELIKRCSELSVCVCVCVHAYACTHSSLHCQKGKGNYPRAKQNEMLIMRFGTSCYYFFQSERSCLLDSLVKLSNYKISLTACLKCIRSCQSFSVRISYLQVAWM